MEIASLITSPLLTIELKPKWHTFSWLSPRQLNRLELNKQTSVCRVSTGNSGSLGLSGALTDPTSHMVPHSLFSALPLTRALYTVSPMY